MQWTDISVSFVFNGKTFDIALVRFLLSGKDRDWCMDSYQAAPVTWNIISLHEKKHHPPNFPIFQHVKKKLFPKLVASY